MDLADNLYHPHANAPAQPHTCQELGKDCRDCVSQSASLIALLCPSLDPPAAQATFFKLYPSPGCVNMSRVFVRVYLSETEVEQEIAKPRPMTIATSPYSVPNSVPIAVPHTVPNPVPNSLANPLANSEPVAICA